MSLRIYLFACAGLLLASANPVPQDADNPVQTTDVDQPEENTTSEPPSVNSDDVIRGTVDSLNVDEETATSDPSEIESSETENESDSNLEADENSSDDEEEKNVSDVGSDEKESEKSDHDQPESSSDTDESVSNGSDNNNSEDNGDQNNSDNDVENENGSDLGLESDESESGSESSVGYSDENEKAPENVEILSIVESNKVLIKLYKFVKGNQEIVCQEIQQDAIYVEKRCFTKPTYLSHLGSEKWNVFPAFIDGLNFTCQKVFYEVIEHVQVLCASVDTYFFQDSTTLPPSYRNFRYGSFLQFI